MPTAFLNHVLLIACFAMMFTNSVVAAPSIDFKGIPLGIRPCIPGRKSRGKPIRHDKRRYRCRSRIEISFGRLKDWRRVATRYDRCPKVFLFAVALAATVIFWPRVLTLVLLVVISPGES